MYSRTQNDNGTYNTRCLDCFMTVSFCVESEEELAAVEANHMCPEKVLAQLQMQKKPAEAGATRH
jgi:hypothetical protein